MLYSPLTLLIVLSTLLHPAPCSWKLTYRHCIDQLFGSLPPVEFGPWEELAGDGKVVEEQGLGIQPHKSLLAGLQVVSLLKAPVGWPLLWGVEGSYHSFLLSL